MTQGKNPPKTKRPRRGRALFPKQETARPKTHRGTSYDYSKPRPATQRKKES